MTWPFIYGFQYVNMSPCITCYRVILFCFKTVHQIKSRLVVYTWAHIPQWLSVFRVPAAHLTTMSYGTTTAFVLTNSRCSPISCATPTYDAHAVSPSLHLLTMHTWLPSELVITWLRKTMTGKKNGSMTGFRNWVRLGSTWISGMFFKVTRGGGKNKGWRVKSWQKNLFKLLLINNVRICWVKYFKW